MAFKIGKPIETPPVYRQNPTDGLVEQVLRLENGLALPLEFDDLREAISFISSRGPRFKALHVKAQRRGNIVYLSKASHE